MEVQIYAGKRRCEDCAMKAGRIPLGILDYVGPESLKKDDVLLC